MFRATNHFLAGAILAAGFAVGTPVLADEDYPSRTIHTIVPFGAGGGTDVTIRGFLQIAERQLGHDFTVANVTGGGGAVGWGQVATADPDGYTLTTPTYDLLVITAKEGAVNYKDFVSLITVSLYPQVLAVHAESDIMNFEDFIELASTSESPVSVAMASFGGIHHLGALAIMDAQDVDLQLVPFEGGAPAIAALLGGNVQATFTDVPESKGRPDLRVIVQFSEERHPDMPDVPTAHELGMDIEMDSFRTIAAPVATPDEVVAYLREAFERVWHSDEFQDWAARADISPAFVSGPDTDAMLEAKMPFLKEGVARLQQ